MALIAMSGELPDGTNALRTLAGAMSTKVVYGNECSISVARREAGYHSRPHYHESEQLNYVVDGQMWVFIEDDGFVAHEGDFFRVPANAVHWAFNNSDQSVTAFQVHAPRWSQSARRRMDSTAMVRVNSRAGTLATSSSRMTATGSWRNARSRR